MKASALLLVSLFAVGCGGGVPESTQTPGAPEITSQPSDVSALEGSSFSLSVTASGDNLSYQWYKNDVIQFDKTGSTYSVGSASPTDNDRYHVVVSNDKGSVQSREAYVSVMVAN